MHADIQEQTDSFASFGLFFPSSNPSGLLFNILPSNPYRQSHQAFGSKNTDNSDNIPTSVWTTCSRFSSQGAQNDHKSLVRPSESDQLLAYLLHYSGSDTGPRLLVSLFWQWLTTCTEMDQSSIAHNVHSAWVWFSLLILTMMVLGFVLNYLRYTQQLQKSYHSGKMEIHYIH